jgi:hypothetical protein
MEVEDRIEDGFWILVELATWKLILSGDSTDREDGQTYKNH